MKITKRQLCAVIAAAVSICFLVCLISTVRVAASAMQSGGEFPMGMGMLTLVTAACTVLIWKGVREMD